MNATAIELKKTTQGGRLRSLYGHESHASNILLTTSTKLLLSNTQVSPWEHMVKLKENLLN